MITGIPASPGIVFGKALVLKEEKIVLDSKKFQKIKSTQKSLVFMRVVKLLLSNLIPFINAHLKSLGEEKAAIFEGHLMILEDEE